MTKKQQFIYKAFLEFKRICKEHGLRYWASGGTLIGAMRHKGFIPWDDDMDLYMHRKDYQRFIDIVLNSSDKRFGISCMEDGRHLCPYHFTKFFATDCTVWEGNLYPLIVGPWVDIFPIDEYDEELSPRLNDCCLMVHDKYRRSIAQQSWRNIAYDIFHLRGMNGWMGIVRKCWSALFRDKYYRDYMRLCNEMAQVKSDSHYFHAMESYMDEPRAKKFIWKKEIVENLIEVPFEDTTITIPADYESVLTLQYGNWRELPPENERQGGHACYYTDLNTVKTIEQVRKEIGPDNHDREHVFTFAEFWHTLKQRIRHLN